MRRRRHLRPGTSPYRRGAVTPVAPVAETSPPVVMIGRRRATGSPKPLLIGACRLTGRLLARAVLDLQVRGREHVPARGPVLLAGNHTGFLDGPLVFFLVPRPASFLAKSELFTGPLARILGWLGQVPVHRGRPDRSALRQGLRVLAGGGALGVFPEGTRGTGSLSGIHHGVAYLALRAGCRIVPVAVLGSADALPRGSHRPRWRTPVTVAFGPPLAVTAGLDSRSRRALAEAAEEIRAQLVAHLAVTARAHLLRGAS